MRYADLMRSVALAYLLMLTLTCAPQSSGFKRLVPIVDVATVQPVPKWLLDATADALSVTAHVCPRCEDTQVMIDLDEKVYLAEVRADNVIAYNLPRTVRVIEQHGYEGVVMLAGHEYGHVACGCASQELADAWAGCVGRQLGYAADAWVDWVEAWIPEDGERRRRAQATYAGWTQCEILVSRIGVGDQYQLLVDVLGRHIVAD